MSRPIHPARLPLALFLKSCTEAHVRRSGPGGQHRNRVATGVVLTHTPTNISAEATERRSQNENKVNAIHRLRLQLALHVRLPCDVTQWTPSDEFKTRCRKGELQCNKEHDDYPALTAEVLDFLAVASFRPRALSDRLHELYCGVASPSPAKIGAAKIEANQEERKLHPEVEDSRTEINTADTDPLPAINSSPAPLSSSTRTADHEGKEKGEADPTLNKEDESVLFPLESPISSPVPAQEKIAPTAPTKTPRVMCSGKHVSANQITDFLAREPLVLRHVNACRVQQGLPRLLL